METLRCKFRVESVKQAQHGAGVSMYPVFSTDPNSENRRFWDALPSGRFEIFVSNKDAIAHIEPGQEYFIDIIPAASDVEA
jgi:hypothetical protein